MVVVVHLEEVTLCDHRLRNSTPARLQWNRTGACTMAARTVARRMSRSTPGPYQRQHQHLRSNPDREAQAAREVLEALVAAEARGDHRKDLHDQTIKNLSTTSRGQHRVLRKTHAHINEVHRLLARITATGSGTVKVTVRHRKTILRSLFNDHHENPNTFLTSRPPSNSSNPH